MARPTLSTHVLDMGLGRPAAGVLVSVFRGDDLISRGRTDGDGRIRDLAIGGLDPGTYRIVFDLSAQGASAFYSRVSLDVELEADGGNYHIPLLVSAYGCVSYRGS
ncbi:MAG TPA: hydroxyisourate hydrolase [Candidatus Limnocylindrales bacterium]|nr:hydroxyisourate hydrolase [Candidatus Limnocylindrales bacterium]